MEHPTNLGPRQRHGAQRDAEMIEIRADGVARYIANGEGFIHSDREAIDHLHQIASDATRLISMLEQADRK